MIVNDSDNDIDIRDGDVELEDMDKSAPESDSLIDTQPEDKTFKIPKESLWAKIKRVLQRKPRLIPRVVSIPYDKDFAKKVKHQKNADYYDKIEANQKFPQNIVRNQKYNIFTFLPLTLYDQFKYFYNLYFLGIP